MCVVSDGDKPVRLTVVPGDREALERELLWNIALDGDLVRRAQLYRMLTPPTPSWRSHLRSIWTANRRPSEPTSAWQ